MQIKGCRQGTSITIRVCGISCTGRGENVKTAADEVSSIKKEGITIIYIPNNQEVLLAEMKSTSYGVSGVKALLNVLDAVRS